VKEVMVGVLVVMVVEAVVVYLLGLIKSGALHQNKLAVVAMDVPAGTVGFTSTEYLTVREPVYLYRATPGEDMTEIVVSPTMLPIETVRGIVTPLKT